MKKNLTIETAHKIVDLEKAIKEQNDLIARLSEYIFNPSVKYYSLRFYMDSYWNGGPEITKDDMEAIINYRKQKIEKYQKELDSLTNDEE